MVKLVAIGNRLMKDDGVAVEAAKLLSERFDEDSLEIIIAETDYQSSFYLLDEDDFVIILDALDIGEKPGSIHIFRLEEIISQYAGYYMPHDMNIIELMKLYNRTFHGYLIGIEAADIGLGLELSPVLLEQLPHICSEVEGIIKSILGENSYA